MDTLWHIGKVKPENVLPPIRGPFWNYRHRARLTVRDVAKKGGVLVGFHEKASSYVCDMHACPILTQNVSDMIDPLRELISVLDMRQRMPQIEVAVGGDGPHSARFPSSGSGVARGYGKAAGFWPSTRRGYLASAKRTGNRSCGQSGG